MGGTVASIAYLMVLATAIVGGNVALSDSRKGGSNEPPAGARADRLVVVTSNAGEGRVDRRVLPEDPALGRVVDRLRRGTREFRKQMQRERMLARFRPLPEGVDMEQLDRIADCESGGDPRIVSSNGLYHGKYQFHPDTWASVGGSGLPSEAPEVEQDFRAGLLLARSGPGQWPICGS